MINAKTLKQQNTKRTKAIAEYLKSDRMGLIFRLLRSLLRIYDTSHIIRYDWHCQYRPTSLSTRDTNWTVGSSHRIQLWTFQYQGRQRRVNITWFASMAWSVYVTTRCDHFLSQINKLLEFIMKSPDVISSWHRQIQQKWYRRDPETACVKLMRLGRVLRYELCTQKGCGDYEAPWRMIPAAHDMDYCYVIPSTLKTSNSSWFPILL